MCQYKYIQFLIKSKWKQCLQIFKITGRNRGPRFLVSISVRSGVGEDVKVAIPEDDGKVESAWNEKKVIEK